ncbi:MAG: YeeE/YedE thiosulfate transporter family protein [Gammaproteobacteria bacterium]
MVTTFTPVSALIGGMLIGLAASLLLLLNGRIAGISGIFHGGLRRQAQPWQWLFLLGLVLGSLLYSALPDTAVSARQGFPMPMLLLAGLLVGFGTRLGSGCTSGHGICGISRRSLRSVLATLVFMLTGFLSTWLVRHFFNLL